MYKVLDVLCECLSQFIEYYKSFLTQLASRHNWFHSLFFSLYLNIFEHKATCCTLYRQHFEYYKKKEWNWLKFPFSFKGKSTSKHKIVMNVNYEHKNGFMMNWMAIILEFENLNTLQWKNHFPLYPHFYDELNLHLK